MNAKSNTFRNVAIFSLAAISCGWIGVGLNQLLGEPSNLESLGSLIFIATPIVCMLLLRLLGGDGWKDLPLKPRFKQNASLVYLCDCSLSRGCWHNAVCWQTIRLGRCEQV